MTLEKSSVVGARPGLEAARGEPPLRVGAERRRLAGGPAVRVPRVADDVRANTSREMVRDRFTIQRMATTLDGVYRGVAREEAELRKPVERAI